MVIGSRPQIYRWEQPVREGQVSAYHLNRCFEPYCFPVDERVNVCLVLGLKKLSVLPFPGSRSGRQSSFLMCIGPEPRRGLESLSDQQEPLCQSPSVTDLSAAPAPQKKPKLSPLWDKGSRSSFSFLKGICPSRSLSCRKDQNCPLPRRGMTPSHFPCPRRTGRRIT